MEVCKLFKKILVANRGEAAVGVIRTCKELGIPTVAIYSEADRAALHVRLADEAYCVGAPPSGQSYASPEKVLEVAKKAGCDAVHPGSGFLSERADFAERCGLEGVTFIGANPEALRVVANKVAARLAAVEAGVPVVPGMMEKLLNEDHAREWAEKIGYPVMLKAVAGAGGNGIRKVDRKESLHASFTATKSEARNCFGDESLYMERFVENPRHVGVQVLADRHGAVVHCMERECSIQRRYQGIVEESPSPIVDDEMRSRMGEAAVRMARAIKLDSAGTVEFIVSGKTREYFFLKMHTGVQMGHAVTEAVLGIDLCKEMIGIAAGRPLGFRQDEIRMQGHAIECRIYAEDSGNDFLPTFGRIAELRMPGGPGVRNESGMFRGLDVPVYYDPLLAKLVIWDSTRERCIARSLQALSEYLMTGITTTIPFHKLVMQNEHFIAGDYDATFTDAMLEKTANHEKPCTDAALIAAVIKAFRREQERALRGKREGANSTSEPLSAWKMGGRTK